MKLYFIDIHGNLLEYTRLEPSECRGMAPAEGCDMLIKCKHGHVSSANSKSYFATIKQAVEAFADKQRGYIDQTRERLERERLALLKALSHQVETNTVTINIPAILKVLEQLVEEHERGREWISDDTIEQAVNILKQAGK